MAKNLPIKQTQLPQNNNNDRVYYGMCIYYIYILNCLLSFWSVSNIFWQSSGPLLLILLLLHSHPALSSSFCFSSCVFFSSFPAKNSLAKFVHFPFLKLDQRVQAHKGYPSHRPHHRHPQTVGAPPLIIKPTLWPPSCFPSHSSCNPLFFLSIPIKERILNLVFQSLSSRS